MATKKTGPSKKSPITSEKPKLPQLSELQPGASTSSMIDLFARRRTDALTQNIDEIVSVLQQVSALAEPLVQEKILSGLVRDETYGKKTQQKAKGLMMRARVLLRLFEENLGLESVELEEDAAEPPAPETPAAPTKTTRDKKAKGKLANGKPEKVATKPSATSGDLDDE